MNPLYRAWWRMLMDLRPLVRFLAERFPKLAPWTIRLRSALHLAIGKPIQTLAGVDVLLLWWLRDWPARWLALGFAIVCLVVEVVHRIGTRHGMWLSGWREAWRFRRRWPSDWAGVAAKTTRVQAEVGTSKEPIASALLRPVADHPKMSWWPRIEWPIVSWWVGPPPGRSLAALDELTTIGSEIDGSIEDSVNETGRPSGLFRDVDLGEGSSYRIWIKSWSEVIAEAEDGIEFFREELELNLDAIEAIQSLRDRYPKQVPADPDTV